MNVLNNNFKLLLPALNVNRSSESVSSDIVYSDIPEVDNRPTSE